MRRVFLAALLGSVTLVSCTEEPTTGIGQGGIAFEIHTVGIMPRSNPAGVGEPAAVGEPTHVGPARAHGSAIDSARVVLTSPALSAGRIVSATPGSSVTVDNLPIGTYAAELQGWHDDELVYGGSVSGIQVRSDQDNAVAQVLFAPTSLDFESIGETVQLTSPAGTTWSSASTGIVTVSSTGLLTALTNGSAAITGTLSSSSVGVAARVAQVVDSVSITPASPTIAAGATQQFTARGFDALGTEVTGVSALWVSANHLVATISPTGLATGTGGGTVAISASVRGEPGSANLTVTGQAPATRVRFFTEPFATPQNATFSVSVQIENAVGTRVGSASNAVTLAIGTNPSSGTLSGLKTVNAVNGVATFNDLSIDNLGAGYTLTATSGSLTSATSVPFNVVSQAPTHLAFTSIPTGVLPNQLFNVSVQVRNAAGTTAVGATNVVTLAIGTNPSSGTLSGPITANAVNGTATFSGVSINNVGQDYTLTASATSLTGATSGPIDVVSNAATQLTFSPTGLTVLKDQPFAFTVTLRNALGGVVTTSSDTVTVAIGTNPANGTLTGVKKVTALNGVANFSGLSIDSVGVGYMLTATSGSLTAAVPMALTVAPPGATRLQFFNVPPAALMPDSIFNVQVALVNATGNLHLPSEPVTLAIGTNPGGGTLTGIKTVHTVSGVANFNGLRINSPGVGYTIVATSGSLAPITTNGFSIVSPPTQIAFRIQPDDTYALNGFPSTVQVELRDALGTRVTAGQYSVSLAIGTNPAAGTLSGTTSQTSFNGIATFPGISINNKGAGYTLRASVSGLPDVISTSFDISGVTTVFMNGSYVDITDDDGVGVGFADGEANNLYESLLALGQVVTQTTDITDLGVAAALASSDVYMVPEQEIADLTAALGAGARTAIAAFVNAGNTLVVQYSTRAITLMNTIFGLTITPGAGAAPYTLAPAAVGTPFAGGPASVANLSATSLLEDTSLPGGSQVIYRQPSTNDAAVAVIPRGTGRIVFMGWDWFEAPPLGTGVSNLAAGVDWLEVLRRAVSY
jgi:hypothetical protein